MHRIVIVGGGAGGLELITKLGDKLGKNKEVSLLLIDAKLSHVWKPLLHEVASGTLDLPTNEVNYLIHSNQHNYDYIYGSLIQIDKDQKSIQVELTSVTNTENKTIQAIEYDTLILALGSQSNNFNIPGVREHCYFLDSLHEAKQIHDKIYMSYIDMKQNFIDINSGYNVAIIGAGATGVELIFELATLKKIMSETIFHELKNFKINFTLIDSAERILAALSTKVSNEVVDQLQAIGINILTNCKVSSVDSESIYFDDGREIKADLKIWTAGIKAPPILEKLTDFEKDNLHRLKVYATLQTYANPNIFAFGDCAHCQLDAKAPPLGARAQVASQQAEFLANSLVDRIAGKKLPMFRFIEKGSIVSIDSHKAVGEILGGLVIYGQVARATYDALYKLHQSNIHGIEKTLQIMKRDKASKKIKLH